jgi:glutaredoxin 2
MKMIKLPIYYKEKAHYSMGECDVVYHVYDNEGNHICNGYEEDKIKELVDMINSR